MAIVAASPPGVEDLKRRERTPAHVAEAESDTEAAASVAEEADQRGRPVVARGHQAGVPAPSDAIMEPPAVVVGSPAPRVVADPSPTIPIFPNPAAGLVRSPVGAHGGTPHVAVFRHAGPGAGGIQILSAVHSRTYVAGTGGLRDHAVAAVAPTIPIVHSAGGHNLELGIAGGAAGHQSLPIADPLRATGR